MKKRDAMLIACLSSSFALGLALLSPAQAAEFSAPKLDPDQVENIVKRSYQYVAMYNVINKSALAPSSSPMGSGGWNKLILNTGLYDASVKSIARPNNDSLYQVAILDLRSEPVILDVPAFDSKYVSLETSAYDHYVNVPMSTRLGDYKKPEKLLFFTMRTKGYKAGDKIDAVDRYLEMSGDFVIAFHRVMPHANEPARFKRIVEQIKSLKVLTLSEYRGKPKKAVADTRFPAVGKTDGDVFGNNLLEVMQFVFNHTSFDPMNEIDQALLAAYKPLGVEPGKAWDPSKAAKIDGAMFREVAAKVQKDKLALLNDPVKGSNLLALSFQPKGKIELDTLVTQSVIGPIGLPAAEAIYPPISTLDGRPMNALHDYVVKMSKDQLPPARAFWSLTLYDTQNGFFIPNLRNKYSVGENAGFKLNADGGIEIHVAAAKPAGVPDENWLPINRDDEGIGLIMRIYVPDLEKMKTWKAPNAVLVK